MTAKRRSERTIGRALSFATGELREAGFETPRLDAEVLLGSILGKTRTQLAIDKDQEISEVEQLQFLAALGRRFGGEPVAYIAGTREFMGHDFAVGPGVLVPRPETELLVERAIEMLDRLWPSGAVRVLDLCTGSGAIALSLALETDPGRVQITGSDISPDALAYARRNRAALDLDDRVALVEGDLLSWTTGPWDLILSNPPYLRPEQIDGNLEIGAEPRLALDGGQNGIELIERILDQARARVARRFGLLIELDPDHADAVRALAVERFPTAGVIIVPDLTGRDRFVSIEAIEAVEREESAI